MTLLETFDTEAWDASFEPSMQERAVRALESGKMLYFPKLEFRLDSEELAFLTPMAVDPKAKNISYDMRSDRLGGTTYRGVEADKMKAMIRRYALSSRQFLEQLIPDYTRANFAKTSLRTVEIEGRKNPSYRKDDTRLHVDSFPSSPTKGKRILRIFTNINPEGKPRVWRLGESFDEVVKRFAPQASHPVFGMAKLLQLLRITKDYRTPYDHYMLQIHDTMKGDVQYQETVQHEQVILPPGSSWIVYTDQVSHAAMSGQHVLEQTVEVPVRAMQDEWKSPVRVLERFYKKNLV